MSNITKKAFPVLNMHLQGALIIMWKNSEETGRCGRRIGQLRQKKNTHSWIGHADFDSDEIRTVCTLLWTWPQNRERGCTGETQEGGEEKTLPAPRSARALGLVLPLFFSMVLMHVPFSNEIQLILALPVMIFLVDLSTSTPGGRHVWGGVTWIRWWH